MGENKDPMKTLDLCVFCKKHNFKHMYNTYDANHKIYTVNHCLSCNSYFLSPNPSKQDLEIAYSTDYYGEGSHKFNSKIERIIEQFRQHRARRLSGYLPNKQAKVLDIGCGNGRFLQGLLKYGDYTLYGVELPGNSANRAQALGKINLKIGSLSNEDFPEHTFDAITLIHVLEHLTNPEETLQIISKILKPNGLLMIAFPNISSLQSLIFKGHWFHLDPPRHVFFMSPTDLINRLKQFNLKVIRVKYFDIEQNPFGYIQSILNVFSQKRDYFFESLKSNNSRGTPPPRLLTKILFLIIFPIAVVLDFLESILGMSATTEIIMQKEAL